METTDDHTGQNKSLLSLEKRASFLPFLGDDYTRENYENSHEKWTDHRIVASWPRYFFGSLQVGDQ